MVCGISAIREKGIGICAGLAVFIEFKRKSSFSVVFPAALFTVKAEITVFVNAAIELVTVKFQKRAISIDLCYLALRVHRLGIVNR